MITTLHNSQKTTEERKLLTHTLFLLLFFLCAAQLSAQQADLCSTLPEARFQLSQIDKANYLNIESLHFPQNSEDPLSVSYYIVIESENGDYNNQWGPFDGPNPRVFSKEFGPLTSESENFKFSIQATGDNAEDCDNKISFVSNSDDKEKNNSNSFDDQMENWDTVFSHIENFEFDNALIAARTKRNFTAEDAALYEFATFEIERGQKDQFEVYFKVYPNPAENEVFIQNIETKERELTLIIMDLNGGVKMKKEFEVAKYNKVRMNINRLKTGNYICAIMNKNKRIIGMKHLYKL